MTSKNYQENQDDIIVELCDPEPLTAAEKSALTPCLLERDLTPDMLDIITSIPRRTRVLKVRSGNGELLGLTSILLTPSIFMKHCYGQGNHISTNNTFFFTKKAPRTRVLSAIFRKFIELRPFGQYIGFIDDDMTDDFRSALEEVPHVVADRVLETGSISTKDPSAEQVLLKEHRHLSRQVNRFRNKGGTIHFHEGTVAKELADDFVACCLDSYHKNTHPGTPIDIYAKLNERVVGVQIFIRHQRHLELTEGGFLSQTYHAYENIVVASVRYAAEQGLDRVSYGLILNQPKDRLMDKDTRKPVFLVLFFRDEPDPATLDDYRYKAHERFPMLYWRERNAFPALPL